jgi:hypothetical protein
MDIKSLVNWQIMCKVYVNGVHVTTPVILSECLIRTVQTRSETTQPDPYLSPPFWFVYVTSISQSVPRRLEDLICPLLMIFLSVSVVHSKHPLIPLHLKITPFTLNKDTLSVLCLFLMQSFQHLLLYTCIL